jgi:putative transposase
MFTEERKTNLKEAIRATKEKRKSQTCSVYTLKITNPSDGLRLLFHEAKWFYNHCLSQNDIFDISVRKAKQVSIKVLDSFENRELKNLSSQMKMGLHEKTIANIKMLSTIKKKGNIVGRLKFSKEVNSIPLPQYDTTYKLLENNRKVKIQGIKKPLRILGFNQLPKEAEFANGRLIKKASGYYLQITTFIPKEIIDKSSLPVIGIDMGIKDSIVLSNGEKYSCKLPETDKLKELQKKLKFKTKWSKNREELKRKIKKEYEKISNKKNDKANKLVNYLKTNYSHIYFQDENLKGWQKGLFGKQIQMSYLGTIKSKLKSLESITMLRQSEPTTQLCPSCGALNKHSLKERTYICSCGYSDDRDTHSAKNMILIGSKNYPRKELASTPLEEKTNVQKISHSPLKEEECESLAHI